MTKPWIESLEHALDRPLPPELRALYETGDGESASEVQGRPFRLMRSDETLAVYDELRSRLDLRGACPFWEGRDGNWAATYLDGPLTGRVFCSNEESEDPCEAVTYRSCESFVASMNFAAQSDLDWYEVPTDYFGDTGYFHTGSGVCNPAFEDEIDSDRQTIASLRDAYAFGSFAEDAEMRWFCFNVIAMTPASDLDQLFEFFDWNDMWVQERACNAIGRRKHLAAIGQLGRMSREPMRGNGQTAALTALGKIGTPEALAEIVASVSSFPEGLDLLVAQAMRACGCEARFEQKKGRTTFFFRSPGETDWRPLR